MTLSPGQGWGPFLTHSLLQPYATVNGGAVWRCGVVWKDLIESLNNPLMQVPSLPSSFSVLGNWGPQEGKDLSKSHSWEVAEPRLTLGLSGSEVHTLTATLCPLQLCWLYNSLGLWDGYRRGSNKNVSSGQMTGKGNLPVGGGRRQTILFSSILQLKCSLPFS